MINLMNGKAESRKESVGANFFNKINKMKYFRVSMKNVGAIVACFAVRMMFSGCSDDEEPNDENIATVTNVAVTPASASVAKGATQLFSATVTGDNEPAQTVTWSITETGKSANTGISATGLLTVAADESLATLTVVATSTVDTNRSGTATVTITGGSGGGGDDDPPSIAGDGTLNVKLEGSNYGQISSVKLIYSIQDYGKGDVLASAGFSSGSFSIILPATVAGQYLEDIEDEFDAEGITISNKSAKICVDPVLIAYNSSGNEIGFINYQNQNGDYIGFLSYLDRDVTISGTSTTTSKDGIRILNLNLVLKQGWNFLYQTSSTSSDGTRTTTGTTTAPSGLKWYFRPSTW
jgi:hypothetical protein